MTEEADSTPGRKVQAPLLYTDNRRKIELSVMADSKSYAMGIFSEMKMKRNLR